MIGLPAFIARRTLHRLIVWYIDRCGGVLHALPYGTLRRYLVAMDEGEYTAWATRPRIRLYQAVADAGKGQPPWLR